MKIYFVKLEFYLVYRDTILYLQHILSVITMLENSGFEKLVTFCHGDAKPNNFLFRNIEVDIEGNRFYFIIIRISSNHISYVDKVHVDQIKRKFSINRSGMCWTSSNFN